MLLLLQRADTTASHPRGTHRVWHQRSARYTVEAPSASASAPSSSSLRSQSQPWDIRQSLAADTHMAVAPPDQAGPSHSSSSGSSSSSWATRFMPRSSSSALQLNHALVSPSPPTRPAQPFPGSSRLNDTLSDSLPSCRASDRSLARYPILAVCETDDVTRASGAHPHRNTRPEKVASLRPDPAALTNGGERADGGGDQGRTAQSGAATPRRDKQTMDYVIRSGIAGGVAGCVVSSFISSASGGGGPKVVLPLCPSSDHSKSLRTQINLGQDCHCAPGPRQDPLPSAESRVPKVLWPLARRLPRRAGDCLRIWCGRPVQRPFGNADADLSLCRDQVHGVR